MPHSKLMELLTRKAAQDVYVLEKLLADDDAPLEVFGFHAQQATEKLIKAVLSYHDIPYGRTHRLGDLVDCAAEHGVELPAHVEELVDLSPYAVEFRYDVTPEDGGDNLDKSSVWAQVKKLQSWVLQSFNAGK